MPDFEIQIKTSADLKGARDLQSALQDQIKATKAMGQDSSTLETRLKGVDAALKSEAANTVRLTEAKNRASNAAKLLGHDTDKLSQSLAKIGQHVPGFQKLSELVSGLGQGSSGAALAGTLAAIAAGLGALASAGVSEFAESEQAVARLDAALAQSGQLTDDYRESLQSLADQLQTTTGIADDKWLGVLRQLTQFGSTAGSINRDAEAVKNLAGIMGGDLESAATAVARAMQGNFTMFTRFGIQIDEHATQTEKLNKLYQELAQRGGGQLEATNRTLIGQWGQLKNSGGDFLKTIGGLINESGILQRLMGGLTNLFEAWNEKLGSTIPKMDGLANASHRTVQSFEDAKAGAERFKSGLQTLKDEAQETARAVQQMEENIRRAERMEAELDSKNKNRLLAQVDEQEKSGALQKPEAIRRRSQIEEQFSQREVERRKRTNLEAVQAQEGGLNQGVALQRRLEGEISRMRRELPRQVSEEGQIEKIAALQSELAKTREEIEQAPKQRSGYSPEGEFQDQMAVLRQREALLTRLVAVERGRTPALVANSEESRRALQHAKELLEITKKDNDERRKKVEMLRQQSTQENRFIDQGAEIEMETRQIRTRIELRETREATGGRVGRQSGSTGRVTAQQNPFFQNGSGGETGQPPNTPRASSDRADIVMVQRLMHGIKPDSDSQTIYRDASQLVRSMGENRQGLFQIMRSLLSHVQSESRERQELARQVNLLTSRQSGYRTR